MLHKISHFSSPPRPAWEKTNAISILADEHWTLKFTNNVIGYICLEKI